MRAVVDWLPVGHESELARLETVALDAAAGSTVRGAVIRGPLGSGTTTVMDRLAARLVARGWSTTRLVASTGRYAAPLSWLAPLRGPGLDRSDRVSLVHELRTLVRRRAGSTPMLLAVDDAHLLDRADRLVLERLALDCDIVLVSTMTTEREPDRAFAIALHEGLLEPVDLRACTVADVASAASGFLGAPLDDRVVDHLVRVGAGSPLFARELLLAAIARGSVVEDRHRWRFVAPPAQEVTLPQLLSDRVRARSAPARSLLDVLALTGPLPDLPEVRLGVDHDEVPSLVAAGLLASTDGGTLALAHPLLGDVIATGWADPTRRGVAERAVAALSALPDDDPDRPIRIARVAIAHDVRVDDDVLLRAARRSLRQLDAALAEQVLTAVGSTTWDGWFLLGHARAAQGHVDGADRALANAVAIADTDERRARAASRRSNNLVVGSMRFDDAIAVLDDAMARVDDPVWRRFLAVERTHPMLAAGRPASIDAGGGNGSDRGFARASVDQVTEAMRAAASGRGDDCERLVTAGLGTAHLVRHHTPDIRDRFVLARWSWLTVAGRADEARATIRAELDRAAPGDPHVAPWLLARAVDRLVDGDLRRAADEADRATEAFGTFDPHGLGPVAVALATLIAARAGNPRAAMRSRAGVPADRPRDDGARAAIDDAVRIIDQLARAWVEAARGRRHRGAELAAGAARSAADCDQPVLAALAAHDAAWLGRADLAVAALDGLAAYPGGRLAAAIHDHASALVHHDEDTLVYLVDVFPNLGCTASGAQSALVAADIAQAAGRMSDAVRCRARAGELLHRLGPGRAPLPGSTATLTSLERRLAELVAHRRPLEEVATELELPIGVVHEVLELIQHKLGVSNRRALEAAVTVLATQPAAQRRHASIVDTGP